jgi:TPR repeat protein
VTVAAVTPTRDDIRTAYQGALQGGAPQAAAVPEQAMPADVIRHLDASEIAALLKRAESLIGSGDLAAARLVLRRAAEAGDARAAMMLGGTYDPAVLDKMGVRGLVPDFAMARSWYEKAKRLAAPEAASQRDALAKRQD